MSQYSFCWDSVGMDIKDLESVGMDPNRSAPLRQGVEGAIRRGSREFIREG